MLVIFYRRHQHASLDRQRGRVARHTSTRQRVATKKADKQRTQTRWQNHTADGLRVDWVGLEAVIGFTVMSVPVTPIKRDDLLLVQECLGRGGTSQRIVAEVRGWC